MSDISTSHLKGRVGLQNLGNTCFMNSALQCLLHCHDDIIKYFCSLEYKKDLNVRNPIGAGGKVAREFAELVMHFYHKNKNTSKVISPSNFKRTVGQFASQFVGYSQQDSQEFVACLLDLLHEDLNLVKNKPITKPIDYDGKDGRSPMEVATASWQTHLARNQSIIVDFFQGQFKSRLECPDCSKVSITFDPFMYLTLPIPFTTSKTTNRNAGTTTRCIRGIRVLYLNEIIDIDTLNVEMPIGHIKEYISLQILKKLNINSHPDNFLYYISSDYCIGTQLFAPLRQNETNLPETNCILHCYHFPDIPCIDIPSTNLNNVDSITGIKCNSKSLNFLICLRSNAPGKYNSGLNSDGYYVVNNSYLIPLSINPNEWNNNANFIIAKTVEKATNGYIKLSDLKFKIETSFTMNSLDKFNSIFSYLFVNIDSNLHSILPRQFSNSIKYNKPITNGNNGHQSMMSIVDCFKAFSQVETLTDDNMWRCPGCRDFVSAAKQMEIYRLPRILIIHFKRFNYTRYNRRKIDVNIDFPFELDISEYLTKESIEFNKELFGNNCFDYELVGVSNHFGSLYGGHYTGSVLNGKSWIECNDSSISDIGNPSCIIGNQAYLLFYRRK